MSVEDAVKVLTGQQTYSEMFQMLFSMMHRMLEYDQRLLAELAHIKDELKYARTRQQPNTNTWDHWTVAAVQGDANGMFQALNPNQQDSVITELKKEVSRLESAYQKALHKGRR